ncbi:WD40-like Beta Propeller Repeat [Actinoplanes regularis]|uniref:WD40-like Beta Propeller Repeat n=1 Tax=Actinoplanes regularis TaxID=52697 RepID=A0A239BV62_9ACTN|nr:hypothetical protein Are01nite_47790 [Actinoplanes regularis]SNS11053.1 WD40-like Beta Propeller Repeat [Actinoplanes regularis]
MTLGRTRPNWPVQISIISAILAVSLVVLTLAGITSGLFGWHPGTPAAVEGARAVNLPATVGAPGIRSADETKHPVAAAAVLISGNTWFADGSHWYGAVISADSGDYRVFVNNAGAAGFGAVLSPDGRRLASGDGILDIATGRWTAYPQAWQDRELAAQAWSPDGARLAVTSRVPGGDGPYPGTANGSATMLNLLDVGNGAITEVAGLPDAAALDGWTVAFSPDGTRLAYQASGQVRIVTVADGRTTAVALPDGARLAGKGSWTRDGQGLLVVSGEHCSSCGDYPMRWTVTTLAATTGAAVGPRYQVDGAYAVRVLGWWPSGRPVAVAYAPTDDAATTLFDDEPGRYQLISMNKVDSARLLELSPGAVHHQLSSVGTEAIDVADNVLAAGKVGTAATPATTVDRIAGGLLTAAALTAATAVLSGGFALWRRRFRRPAP